ncbi:sorbitol dehydrogenase family protein [Frateuria aurantia]
MKSDNSQGRASTVNQGRRQWLTTTGMLVASGALLPLGHAAVTAAASGTESAVAPSSADIDAFHELGLLLTGRKDLPLDVSARLLTALNHDDASFTGKAQQLAKALADAGVKDINAFPQSTVASDPVMKDTAMKIISGWYLGYTGTPVSLSDTDDTKFITYTAALMFERTREVTVIPTYSRAGTDYWQAPPPAIEGA